LYAVGHELAQFHNFYPNIGHTLVGHYLLFTAVGTCDCRCSFCDRLCDRLVGWLSSPLFATIDKLGAFLDPVADKLIVCIALVMIVGEPQFQL